MKITFLFTFLFLINLPVKVFADSSPLIIDSKSCFRGHAETHDKWVNFLESRNIKFNKNRFLKTTPKERFNMVKNNLICKDFTYEVDGYTVEGYYLKPRNTSNKKLPLIIFNRGGNAEFGYVSFATKLKFIADIAMEGYVIIGSQYRGASSDIFNNGLDEVGGADIKDVLTLLDIAKEIPETDTSNVGMIGWSRGVMQSYVASQYIPELKTIVAIAGNSDVEKALVWRPKMERVYQARVPNFEKNRTVELESRSVSKWLDKIPKNMPILLLHGDIDKRVSVEQSKSLAVQLEEINHPHKLVIYPNGKDSLIKYRKKMKQEITSWLKHNLSN